MKMWDGAVYGKCSVILEKRQLWWCHWCEMNHSSTRSHLFTVNLFMWRSMWLRIIGSLKVVNATSVTKCTIFGPSSPALSFLSACWCILVSFSGCLLSFCVSGFQTATCVCSSAEMEPLRSAASGLETGERPDSNFCHFLLFLFLRSFQCLCVALYSYFPFGTSTFCRFEL